MLYHYRGPTSTAQAILNNESKFGVKHSYGGSGIDIGDTLVQSTYQIGDDESGYGLYMKVTERVTLGDFWIGSKAVRY